MTKKFFFMIDRTDLIESISTSLEKKIHELWNQYPNVYFQFGVVLNINDKNVDFYHLTKNPSQIQKFLNDTVKFNLNLRGCGDLKSSYKVVLNKIKWDEKAAKVVIYILNSSDYTNGKSCNNE